MATIHISYATLTFSPFIIIKLSKMANHDIFRFKISLLRLESKSLLSFLWPENDQQSFNINFGLFQNMNITLRPKVFFPEAGDDDQSFPGKFGLFQNMNLTLRPKVFCLS